ncbi:MAG: hypothetical protein JSU94_00685 [Phycisphaerales bacterium]|nr:MAG: hypothetical protein JSU94_00685 [Phycisphaerales bacterium]
MHVIKNLLLAGLLAALWAGGCAAPDDPQVEHPADQATIKRIDAVKELEWDSNKRRSYHQIAMRGGLNDGGQVYLVKAVFENLGLDSGKEVVLVALIMNPSFSPAAEKAILDRIDSFSFEKSKQRVLRAIEVRKAVQPEQD